MRTLARIALIVSVVSLVACNRAPTKNSTLKFKLPESSQSYQSVGALTAGGWGLSDPSTLSDINCYAVIISDAANDVTTNSCFDSANDQLFSLSELHGLYPSGSEVLLETASGSAKTIRLIGLKSSSNSLCATSLYTASSSNFSMPNVIANKTVDIIPGFNEVVLNANLSAVKVNRCVLANQVFGPSSTSTPAPSAVTINPPGAGFYVNIANVSAIGFSGTCSDNGSTVTISGAATGSPLCGSNAWSSSLNFSSASQGAISITASQGSASDVLILQKDTVAPVVAISSPAAMSLINSGNQSTFTVSGTCTDPAASVSITGNATGSTGCAAGAWSLFLDFSGAADGTVSINVSQTDAAGNTSIVDSRSFNKNTAAPALLAFSEANPYSFQTRAVGASVNNAMTFTNTGSQPATGITGFGISAPYSFVGGAYPGTASTCSGGTLAPGASCSMQLNYNPTSTGTSNQTITLSYNNGVSAQSVSWSISTNAVTPAFISISGGPTLDYGNVVQNVSQPYEFTLTNNGQFQATSLSGSGLAAPFSFVGGAFPGTGASCSTGTPLAAGASCTIRVKFESSTTGVFSDTIEINYYDGAASQTASRGVTGTAVSPASLQISDGPTYDFGNVYLGAGKQKTFTITNTGGVAATGISGVSLSLPYGYFGGTFPGGGTCGTTLGSAATCTVVVEFVPIMAGVTPQAFAIDYNNGAAPVQSSIGLTSDGIIGYLEMAIGTSHVCGRRGNADVRCWAYNSNGQLGNGGTTNSFPSVAVNGSYNFIKLSAGGGTSCGIRTNDSLYCWGANAAGQLGIGSSSDSYSPALVSGGFAWKEISVGYDHTCGITTADALYCWGNDSQGELGNGAGASSSVPALVGGTWKKVSAGWDSTCAINSADNLFCWGTDSSGQIGNGGATGNVTAPQQIGAATYKSVAVGGGHACAVTTSGQLFCWGDNSNGQVGDGSQTSRTAPVQEVAAASYWEYVVAGTAHTCAKTNTQIVKCWGSNIGGVTGVGLTSGNTLTPSVISIGGSPPMRDVFANNGNTCAIEMNGQLYCWGQNNYGQMGTGSASPSFSGTPTMVNPQ